MSESVVYQKTEWLCSIKAYDWFLLPEWVRQKHQEGKISLSEDSISGINPDGSEYTATGKQWLALEDDAITVLEEEEALAAIGVEPLV